MKILEFKLRKYEKVALWKRREHQIETSGVLLMGKIRKSVLVVRTLDFSVYKARHSETFFFLHCHHPLPFHIFLSQPTLLCSLWYGFVAQDEGILPFSLSKAQDSRQNFRFVLSLLFSLQSLLPKMEVLFSKIRSYEEIDFRSYYKIDQFHGT